VLREIEMLFLMLPVEIILVLREAAALLSVKKPITTNSADKGGHDEQKTH
jgi:hypothetical protein